MLPKPSAEKIRTLSSRVAAYRATEAGSLKAAHERLVSTVRLLAEAHVEVDTKIQKEIHLFIKLIKRFRTNTKGAQGDGAKALAIALAELGNVEKILQRAEGRGYGTKALVASSQVDFKRITQLKASLGFRAREAAFILAALEQVVDPLPGVLIASAAGRRRNDKVRAAAAATPDVAPEPGEGK